MLFVVYGATLDMGYETRQIFRAKGFRVIQKYNYVADDADVDKSKYRNAASEENYAKWYDDKIYVEKDQLSRMDFRYDLNGVYLGFNQDQIMDAVRGLNDSIITVGASTMKLVSLLKKAYGDYLTVINLYESDKAVIESTQYGNSMGEKERETRIQANMRMQALYLENREIFDEIVVYTGKDTLFDREALQKQYEVIIEKRKALEKSLNNRRYVALPYSGRNPYIFVSYAHKDRDEVFAVMSAIQRNGFRVWYDDGIEGGANWRLIL